MNQELLTLPDSWVLVGIVLPDLSSVCVVFYRSLFVFFVLAIFLYFRIFKHLRWMFSVFYNNAEHPVIRECWNFTDMSKTLVWSPHLTKRSFWPIKLVNPATLILLKCMCTKTGISIFPLFHDFSNIIYNCSNGIVIPYFTFSFYYYCQTIQSPLLSQTWPCSHLY